MLATVCAGAVVAVNSLGRPSARSGAARPEQARNSAAAPAECDGEGLSGYVDGAVDGAVDGPDVAYELALTNTNARTCMLTGRVVAIRGSTTDGRPVTVPVLSSAGQPPTGAPGPARPGEPEHVVLRARRCARPRLATLELDFVKGAGEVDAADVSAAMLPGGLAIGCGVQVSRFFGPISAFAGQAPAAVPLATLPCHPANIRVLGVTGGKTSYDIALRAIRYDCLVSTSNLTAGVTTGLADSGTPAVIVTRRGTVHVRVGSAPGTACGGHRRVVDLGLRLSGQALHVPSPATGFVLCSSQVRLSLGGD